MFVTKGIRNSTREDLVDEFLKEKFKGQDVDQLDTEMYEKLKEYMISELRKKELFFNINFNEPSKIDVESLYNYEDFIENISSMLVLEDDIKKEAKVEEEIEDEPLSNLDQEQELEYLDRIFNRIGKVIGDTQRDSSKLLASFMKLRENYFRLNNMQRMDTMRQNPELLLQMIELEDSLVMRGVLLPSEIDNIGSIKNLEAFGIEKKQKSANEEHIKEFIEITPEDTEKVKVKNKIIFRHFMEKVGVDMNFTEKCFEMARALPGENNGTSGGLNLMDTSKLEDGENSIKKKEVIEKLKKMNLREQEEKFLGLSRLLEYLQIHLGDRKNQNENYIASDFELMFGFEKNTRELIDYNSVLREMKETQENFETIDSDQATFAR